MGCEGGGIGPRISPAPGVQRVDGHGVIFGISPVLKASCRWCDGPAEHGSLTKVARWRCATASIAGHMEGFRLKPLDDPVETGAVTNSASIDNTDIKAHRAAPSAGDRCQAPSRRGRSRQASAARTVSGPPGLS